MILVVNVRLQSDHDVSTTARDFVCVDHCGLGCQLIVALWMNTGLADDCLLLDLLLTELSYGIQTIVATKR